MPLTKREFERELWLACDGYFGGYDWKAKDGRDYQWVMDDLARDTTSEQWLIVDLTLDMIGDPDFITGDAPLDTPVSPNEWDYDYETVFDWKPEDDRPDQPFDPFWRVISPADEPAPLGWWFCIEDLIPSQMTAEQALNYTGPFATEREAFIAVIQYLDSQIDSLVAELQLVRSKPSTYALPIRGTDHASQ